MSSPFWNNKRCRYLYLNNSPSISFLSADVLPFSKKQPLGGETIGRRNENPFLDTRVYESEFPDVDGVAISFNTAATSLFSNCLYYGHYLMIFRSLLDHKSDMTVFQRDDAFVKRNSSNSKREKTTRGCQLLVEGFNGTMTWINFPTWNSRTPFKLLNKPVETALLMNPPLHGEHVTS